MLGAVGALGTAGPPGMSVHSGLVGPERALAANNCSHPIANGEFTGIQKLGYGGLSPASGIIGQFTVNQPSFLCNWGLAYWDMVGADASDCSGGGVYAQAGWLDDGNGNPQHFYEYADHLYAPDCDPGPILWAAAKWSTSHNYKVVEGNQNQGGFASFYTDGVLMNTVATDWAGTQYFIDGEISYTEEYMGGQQIRSLYHCEAVGGCTPNSAVNVGNWCAASNTQGCTTSKNPNGCYLYNSATTTTQGFNVYEKRSQNPPSC